MTLHQYSGLRPVLGNDLRQAVRTVGVLVLAVLASLTAVMSPVTAKYAPQILSAMFDPALVDALQAGLPEPSAAEAYAQWVKNLSQMMTFAVILVAATGLAAGVRGPSVAFVLTRRVGRAALLLSSVATTLAVTLVVGLAGALVTWGTTALLFGGAAPGPVLAATLVWWLTAALLIAAIALVAAATGSVGAAAGAGLVVYLALGVGGLWDAGARYSPLGLGGLASRLAAGGDAAPTGAEVLWPVLTTVAAVAALVALAIRIYQRVDLA